MKLDNINHIRDFIDIADINSAIKLLHRKKLTGIYNLGSGKPTFLINVVKHLASILKKKYVINKLNKQTKLVADIRKIKKLGWKPKKDIIKILNSYHFNYKK